MTDEQKELLISKKFDVTGTVARFMGKDDLYEKFLVKFLDDKNYDGLKKALDDKNYKDAYMYAHTLKGVAGNLGITGLFDDSTAILQKFKDKEYDDLDSILESFEENYQVAMSAIQSL